MRLSLYVSFHSSDDRKGFVHGERDGFVHTVCRITAYRLRVGKNREGFHMGSRKDLSGDRCRDDLSISKLLIITRGILDMFLPANPFNKFTDSYSPKGR